jgi:alanyl-tRNA synthetase
MHNILRWNYVFMYIISGENDNVQELRHKLVDTPRVAAVIMEQFFVQNWNM